VGELSAAAHPAGGASFRFTLPRAAAAPAEQGAAAPASTEQVSTEPVPAAQPPQLAAAATPATARPAGMAAAR
jgi:hypothetical protein